VQYLAEYIFRKFDKRDWVIKNLVNLDEHHYRRHSNGSYYPKATIVIPTRDKSDLLRSCISSVRKLTEYPETEIIIVDNQSKETATISYLAELEASGVRVLRYNERFNYSAICNLAAENASGDYLCFLNNDTEVIRPDWLKCMVEHARQPEVGVVGAIMTFPHGRLQHMGVALEYTGVAGHPGRLELSIDDVPDTCFEVSAVTFACAVVSAEKFKKLGGLNPEFPVAFNDVDFSIRSANAGYQNVLCVRSHLLHHESRSRKRASSLSGFVQGVKDVLLLISKHQSSLSENFFARSILPNKPGKQRHFKSPKHHSAPKNGKQKDPKSIL
jgi:GT2 family glycosyltransferase